MKHTLVICVGSSCFSRGNGANVDTAESYIAANGYNDEAVVELSGTLCRNRCSEGPIVIVDGREYTKVDGEKFLAVLRETLPPKLGRKHEC